MPPGLEGRSEGVARAKGLQPRRRIFSLGGECSLAVVSDRVKRLILLEFEEISDCLGLHITDHQMRLYMTYRLYNDATIAAAKSGIQPGHRLPDRG